MDVKSRKWTVRKIPHGTNLSCPKTSSTLQSPLPAETSPAWQPPLTDILSWVSAKAPDVAPLWRPLPEKYPCPTTSPWQQPPRRKPSHAKNSPRQQPSQFPGEANFQGGPSFHALQLPMCPSYKALQLHAYALHHSHLPLGISQRAPDCRPTVKAAPGRKSPRRTTSSSALTTTRLKVILHHNSWLTKILGKIFFKKRIVEQLVGTGFAACFVYFVFCLLKCVPGTKLIQKLEALPASDVYQFCQYQEINLDLWQCCSKYFPGTRRWCTHWKQDLLFWTTWYEIEVEIVIVSLMEELSYQSSIYSVVCCQRYCFSSPSSRWETLKITTKVD